MTISPHLKKEIDKVALEVGEGIKDMFKRTVAFTNDSDSARQTMYYTLLSLAKKEGLKIKEASNPSWEDISKLHLSILKRHKQIPEGTFVQETSFNKETGVVETRLAIPLESIAFSFNVDNPKELLNE